MMRQPTHGILLLYPVVMTMIAGVALSACSSVPFLASPTLPPNVLAYEAPVSLNIKKGATLPGTNLAYAGKTATGAANVLVGGQSAPKQMGDTANWQGTPAPNTTVKLTTRVLTFDDQSVTLAGTANIELTSISIKPGGTMPTAAPMEYKAPVTYSISKGQAIDGTNVAYAGTSSNGALFTGLQGVPYRNTLDSLQYIGQVNSKVYLQLDLRVISFSDTNAVVGGTATIDIQTP